MELRRVDPRTLKKNPSNPRKIQPGEMSDAALKATIKVVGIIQPPTVSEKDGALTIVYGSRRVRFAIELGLTEIDVIVTEPDGLDNMRSVAENVARAPMATVDLWRSIESLASQNWTEEAIGAALAVPLRQIRKLRLLAAVHPAILDQIGAGDMPRETELRTIASASREDQASVWKKLKPKRGEGAIWWKIAQALEKTRFFARQGKFGEDERAAFGIICSPKGTRTIASLSTARPSCPLSVRGSMPTCPRTAFCSMSTNTAARRCRPRRNAPGRSRRRATKSASQSTCAAGPSMKSSSACLNRKRRKARLARPTATATATRQPPRRRPGQRSRIRATRSSARCAPRRWSRASK